MPKLRFVLVLGIVCACTLIVQATAPRGWYLAGSRPMDYETGIEPDSAYNGHPSAFLKYVHPGVDGFGTLMQDIRAEHYAGKRVRFSAFVKTEDAKSAGLWMRIDNGATAVAFDNMQDRPLKGTLGWQRYSVVLDVPKDATGVFFGVLLSGSGKVWINSGSLEIVGDEIPTTASPNKPLRPEAPANLDFEN